MKIKRYLARDMQEAYLAIRRDLGPDAVIVATHKVRQPGLMGFFLPPRLEVTAALDTVSGNRKNQGNGWDYRETPARVKEDLQISVEGAYLSGIERLQREIGEIKAAINRLTENGNCEGTNLAWQQARLLEQELDKEIVDYLIAGIVDNCETEVIGEIICARLARLLADKVAGEPHQRVQIFIGPTGVGKTTTLAKLAARYSLYQEQKVGLVTLDTYRIGAVDQLRTYADILTLPLEIAMTPREFKEALERLKNCDVVLVDTAGRPPDNKPMLAEIKGFIDAVAEKDVYLVLSSPNRCQDLLRAVERYKCLNFNRLIFTKLDETICPGVIVTVTAAAGVPIRYITTGQDVPEDLELADPVVLARRIWEAGASDGSGGQVA